MFQDYEAANQIAKEHIAALRREAAAERLARDARAARASKASDDDERRVRRGAGILPA